MQEKINELLREMNAYMEKYMRGLVGKSEHHTIEWAEKRIGNETYTATYGKKYVKIIRAGSVVCFIDKDFNVYKPASWAAPAKHIRGNIRDNIRSGFDFEQGLVFVKYLR